MDQNKTREEYASGPETPNGSDPKWGDYKRLSESLVNLSKRKQTQGSKIVIAVSFRSFYWAIVGLQVMTAMIVWASFLIAR